MKTALLLILGLHSAPAIAQVHLPEIEAHLAPIVGDWTIPGQEQTYREICEWYGNRAFVVCSSSDSSDGSQTQSILGYSKVKERFTYQNYNSSGSGRYEFGFPLGKDGLVYTDERLSGGQPARVTTLVRPQADGRLHFVQERSVKGGPWEKVVDFYYVRRR